MTRITPDWLYNPAVAAVFSCLTAAGFQAYAVGGAVRNALLGRAASDVDIATDATPEQVTEQAKAAGLRALPTGIDHGTVTIVAAGTGIEVTTFRRDVETDGRRAVVAFAQDLETDATRRDFTINALYLDPRGRIHDPVGGLRDLEARRVRFIGDAETRIREDALRILRFFRFTAEIGGAAGIDPEGLAASAELADLIDGLSAERIGAEMRKLLSTPDPAPAVASMGQSGILMRILPGADPGALAQLIDAEGEYGPGWPRRLVALGGSLDRLRLSKAEGRRIAQIRAALDFDGGPAARGYLFGGDCAIDAQLIARAAGIAPPPDWEAEIARGATAILPVSAADLMPPFQPGPALGAALKKAEAIWIASGFALDRDRLIQKVTGNNAH